MDRKMSNKAVKFATAQWKKTYTSVNHDSDMLRSLSSTGMPSTVKEEAGTFNSEINVNSKKSNQDTLLDINMKLEPKFTLSRDGNKSKVVVKIERYVRDSLVIYKTKDIINGTKKEPKTISDVEIEFDLSSRVTPKPEICDINIDSDTEKGRNRKSIEIKLDEIFEREKLDIKRENVEMDTNVKIEIDVAVEEEIIDQEIGSKKEINNVTEKFSGYEEIRIKQEFDEGNMNGSMSENLFPSCVSPKKNLSSNSAEKKFACDRCEKTFHKKFHLNRHKLQHSGIVKKYVCEKCDKTYSSSAHLKRHTRSKHSRTNLLASEECEKFICDKCDKTFSRSKGLMLHQVIHSGQKPYSCDKCDKKYFHFVDLKRHQALHTDKRSFSCNKCPKSFKRSAHLKAHLIVHLDSKPFSCDNCDRSFTRKTHLKLHMFTHDEKKPFSCSKCDKSFAQQCNLDKHMLVHAKDDQFACDMCSQSFSRQSQLTIHKILHTDQKLHSCKICKKSFLHKDSIKRHMVIHSVKKFSCVKCKKSFTRQCSLRRHSKVHFRENNQISKKVGEKSSNQKTDLNSKTLNETNKKLFSCNKCDKSYTRMSGLRRHSMIHHRHKISYGNSLDKEYDSNNTLRKKEDKILLKCYLCEKTFSEMSDLKTHLVTHSDRKSYMYSCDDCGRSFTRQSSLKNHIESHKIVDLDI